MQISSYVKLDHVLEPKRYQGCNFDALEVGFYNHKKKDLIQSEFFIVKMKFARLQSQYRYNGKLQELLTRVERWIQDDLEVQNRLLPYFWSQIDEKEKRLVRSYSPKDRNKYGEPVLEAHLVNFMLKLAAVIVKKRRRK